MNASLENSRIDYPETPLEKNVLPDHPLEYAKKWIDEALDSAPSDEEANAMCLSTVSQGGEPSSRFVLLKGVSSEGFLFYTNYLSKKACDIEGNPHVALVFYWPWLHRQLRVQGTAKQISFENSKKYFNSRPRLSQIAAHASKQSQPVNSRSDLLERFEKTNKKFENKPVSCPPFWGGFEVKAHYFEFWQGQPNRLHDRVVYKPDQDHWKKVRLSP